MAFDRGAPKQEVLGEHFRVARELGRGGTATVYLCTDMRSDEFVAVKVLRPEISSVVTKERFFREIDFASELDHARIPRVLESGVSGGLPFYAMDYVEGESLRDRLQREQMAVLEAVRIAVQIAEPMGYAHERGVIHRDIKPENVLLRGDDVFVLDFGVARAIARGAGDRLTGTGITLGTPAYMSPEQVRAEKNLDPRSDIYSLGCVVYEMLAGAAPFRGATPQVLMASRFTASARPLRIIRQEVPELVAHAVSKAMALLPANRWQTASEFATALKPAS